MNKIVREHYPIEKLPEDLRAELTGQGTVTVTIETEMTPPQNVAAARASWNALLERISQLHATGAVKPVTSEEAVARVRALRDEWD
ncbi:hypothetical protein [Bosea vaviloviae]|uniref:Uncharacterized protein n=1 Tax=Bosea vaviloviae TaxID=1526658 RepID=A0A1D7U052_9HYPH|nr:hypothetical protein [Bosea vaviloviae]AOO80749.1 hypothetical protein BHK69_09975 [Bosea vaviloviae]